MISAMEDTGTMQALTFLSQASRVDLQRVLVLRTVSNYDASRRHDRYRQPEDDGIRQLLGLLSCFGSGSDPRR